MLHFRAIYCKQAIVLATNIKNHFDRTLKHQKNRNEVYQITLPLPMPPSILRTTTDFQAIVNSEYRYMVFTSYETYEARKHNLRNKPSLALNTFSPRVSAYNSRNKLIDFHSLATSIDLAINNDTTTPKKRGRKKGSTNKTPSRNTKAKTAGSRTEQTGYLDSLVSAASAFRPRTLPSLLASADNSATTSATTSPRCEEKVDRRKKEFRGMVRLWHPITSINFNVLPWY